MKPLLRIDSPITMAVAPQTNTADPSLNVCLPDLQVVSYYCPSSRGDLPNPERSRWVYLHMACGSRKEAFGSSHKFAGFLGDHGAMGGLDQSALIHSASIPKNSRSHPTVLRRWHLPRCATGFCISPLTSPLPGCGVSTFDVLQATQRNFAARRGSPKPHP